jgi:hypothetical protein
VVKREKSGPVSVSLLPNNAASLSSWKIVDNNIEEHISLSVQIKKQ